MEYEDRMTIVTPEGVSLDLTLAGVGSRALAALVDSLIKGAIVLATVIVVFGGFGALTGDGPDEGSSAFFIGFAILMIILFIINFFYDVAFETLRSGKTPGKKAAGIRVVKEGGAPVKFSSSAIRNVLRLVDMVPTGYLVGLIAILVSSKNQRLGDMAAGTIVVRDRREEQPMWNRPVPVARASTSWDVTTVTQEDLVTVRKFLERRWSLTDEARGKLAWELSERLRLKIGGDTSNLDPEDFLEQVAATKASRT